LEVQKWIDGDWAKANPGKEKPSPEDAAVDFFAAYAHDHEGGWPAVVESKNEKGEAVKKVEAAHKGDEVQSYFFDLWLQEEAWRKAEAEKRKESYPAYELASVPADLVMASGSGLDPHITLANALYQLPDVAAEWAVKSKKGEPAVRRAIEDLL